MKTRYFKSGILAAAAALLYSAAFVSCTDDVTVGEWDGAGSIETGLNETGAVLQEFNRESNTLASKSINAEVTNSAIELKVLIEQMREQIQNIE